MRLRKPSPATLIALLALFVALGGSSYAALQLPRGSVNTKQLKNGAVTSKKVKNDSLLVKDFKASQRSRLRGPQGERGAQGSQGPAGPAGATGAQGEPGSARAYALIGSDGSVTRSRNVTGVSHTAGNGIYCFDLPFTPDNAVASGARPGPGSFSFKTLVTTGVAPDLASGACVAPFTDAVAAVTTAADATGLVDQAFFIAFN